MEVNLYKVSHITSLFHKGIILNSQFSIFILIVFFTSCNPTKYVPQGEYLLDSYEVRIDNKKIDKEQLKGRIRQKPNKRIVGARFHLWLYNSSKLEKTNRWNEWLRKNGEEPVIWQQSINDKSVEQLGLFLKSKGYYYAVVSDTVITKKKRADVIYNIKTGWPYTVGTITYTIQDTSIARLILTDTIHSLVKTGMLLDDDVLKSEFKRMTTNMKNNGYYSFSQDYIEPFGDITNLNRKVNLIIDVKPYKEKVEDNQMVVKPFPKYYIRSLTVNAGMSKENLNEMANMRRSAMDTLKHGDIQMNISPDFPVKASTIRYATYIFPDSLYRLSNIILTQQHLNGLRNFMQITPEFYEVPAQAGLQMRELDCRINLLPFIRQSYTAELEGTSSEGSNFGGGVRLQHQNKSLFRHAEIFNLKLHGLVEAVSGKSVFGDFGWKMEYEAEATLNIPKFILPFSSNKFTRKYNPNTTFSILYNYQQYPDYYVRTVFNTSVGYNWRGSEIISHLVKPLNVNFTQLPSQHLSNYFESVLDRYPYLKNSYQSHMVVSSSYTFVRDMRLLKRNNFFFIRTNFETAGFLLDAAYRLTGQTKEPGQPYQMFGNDFSQFVKGDIDLRYFHAIYGNNQMVTRFFAGVGLPYGNAKSTVTNADGSSKTMAAMPFEKKYYAGGANSIRGWRLRSLGPGSYRDTVSLSSYPNNTGDIKLEANLEYRFKLVWLIEGALFMDAGNIWDTHKDDDRPGASFSFDRFYKEIAVSGGFGLRFDFKYVILRTDLGMKLHDPAGEGRWTFDPRPNGKRRVTWDDFCLSFAIGYPFF